MRFLILLSLLALPCFGAELAPIGVDALNPDNVAKAISDVKENFAPNPPSETDLERATLQGLLDRLAPQVSLVSGTTGAQMAVPFYSELYNGQTGYLRLGDLGNVGKAKAALEQWSGQGVDTVVLDLRATSPSSDFKAGAALAALFCPKDTEMFTLKSKNPGNLKADSGQGGNTGAATEGTPFTSEADPVFKGIVVVLVDDETAEAPEVIAAVLQKCAKALLVGDKTAGRAFEYEDFPLDGAVLRVAVAWAILPNGTQLAGDGLSPDIFVALGAPSKDVVMQSITKNGVASVVEEHNRPHLNEAALVSGSNPEVDELEAEQSGQQSEPLLDRQLQRAFDLVTSIAIYQSKDR